MIRLTEDGEEVKVSKRLGNAITIRELCGEVGVDAVRYFFVQCAVGAYLDFDLGFARKQSNDNPVYYAQYTHAHICSILRQASEITGAKSFELLMCEKGVALMKYINKPTNVISDAIRSRAPHKVCNYIQKLAQHFHSLYNVYKVVDPQQPKLSSQRLALLKTTRITLKDALYLISANAIKEMQEEYEAIIKKSMVDVAYSLMSMKKKAIVFLKLWEEIYQVMVSTKQREEDNIARFYSGLSLNDRFVNAGENKWDPRERHTYHEVVVDTGKILIDEEADDDYEGDDAAGMGDEGF